MSHKQGHFDDGLDRKKPVPLTEAGSFHIREDTEFIERLDALGIGVPEIAVLPRNFKTATKEGFVFESSTSTIIKIGREVKLPLERLGNGSSLAIHENDASLIAPVIVFAQHLFLDGSAEIVIAFLTEFAKHIRGVWGNTKANSTLARLDFVVTDGVSTKSMTYEGPIDGLPHVVELARKALKDDA